MHVDSVEQPLSSFAFHLSGTICPQSPCPPSPSEAGRLFNNVKLNGKLRSILCESSAEESSNEIATIFNDMTDRGCTVAEPVKHILWQSIPVELAQALRNSLWRSPVHDHQMYHGVDQVSIITFVALSPSNCFACRATQSINNICAFVKLIYPLCEARACGQFYRLVDVPWILLFLLLKFYLHPKLQLSRGLSINRFQQTICEAARPFLLNWTKWTRWFLPWGWNCHLSWCRR